MATRFDGVKRFFGISDKPDENRFYQAFLKLVGGGFTSYDQNSKTYLEKGYGTNPDVYAAIQQMTTKTSSIPYTIKKIEDKKAKTSLDKLNRSTKSFTPQQYIKKLQLEKKAFQEEELDFPMERPNELQSWTEIWSLYKTYLKTTGNFYLYKYCPSEGVNKGVPNQVYVLPSHLMQIVLKSDSSIMGVESPISHYILIEGNSYIEFEAENVIHIRYANPFFDSSGGHLYGLSPLRAALLNIQSSNEAILNNNKILKNGGAFGFIHSKGQKAMSQEQAASIKERLKEMDADPGRLSKLAGISSEIGFTRISLTTDELKPFEYLKFDQTTICNVLGWSTKLLNNNDDASGLNNGAMKAEARRVITDNIMPDLNLLCDTLNSKFLPLFKGYENTVIEFDFSELPEMQEDMVSLMKWIGEAIDLGVISRAEGRVLLRLVDNGDPSMHIITVKDDVIPLEEAIQTDFTLNESA